MITFAWLAVAAGIVSGSGCLCYGRFQAVPGKRWIFYVLAIMSYLCAVLLMMKLTGDLR